MKKFLCIFFSLWAVLATPALAYNFSSSYSHYSDGEDLKSVLKDFARVMNKDCVVSNRINGVVSGRFQDVPGNQFLEGLKIAYGVRYYVVNDTIYFFHENDWEQKLVNVGTPQQANILANTLVNSGTVPSELPLKTKGSMLVIQGPSDLVARIDTLAVSFSKNLDTKSVMRVFKLKHAKANDTQISSMNRTIVIPGVASILQKMVNGATVGSSNSIIPMKATVTKLKGTGLASIGATEKPEDEGAKAPTIGDANPGNDQGTSVNIMADTRLNAVIINDAEYKMSYYEKVIRDIDLPVKLVELHAAIVDVDVSAAKDLGISWQGNKRFGSFTVGGGVGKSSNLSWSGTNAITNSTNGGIFSTVLNSASAQFFSAINFLEENQQARTLGRPSVMTLDNVEATLENTTTRYVKVAGYQDVDLFKVESGTVLQVTPHIIEGQPGEKPMISMVVSVQSNQDSNETTSAESDSVPPIKQTKINTQAVVREGQSLLLGGYYVEYKQDDSSGVPGLKDVSVIGKLFGTDSKTKYKRERLILITPKVLDLGEAQAMPDDIDDADFQVSATQDNYLKRPVKKKDSSGC
ncbi:MAG: type III secretion system outer membrane ring subunit SctC, partial [Succinivibrio dextrinosolvens]|nr:type III secretion system outer membrane ring subunit SctC [Succinivibrio dextrinosolvens]